MVNKKNWLGLLVIALVFGMMVVGCGPKGGTVSFYNDDTDSYEIIPGMPNRSTVTVGIAVSSGGTPNAPTAKKVSFGETISASLDEDGYYAVSGVITSGYSVTPFSQSGQLTGGQTIELKATDFTQQ
jgi:hypothetical protein